MSFVNKIIKLADKFEKKLSLAQITDTNIKAVTADAFFGPLQEEEFKNAILASGSNFLNALPQSVKECRIGAKVDSSAGIANFLISTIPAVPIDNIKAALEKDYEKKFGSKPSVRLANRVKQKEVKPGIQASHPSIIEIK